MMAPIIFMADIATLKRGGGKGGLHVNFYKCLKKFLIDLSVPNFNVTDCSSKRHQISEGYTSATGQFRVGNSSFIIFSFTFFYNKRRFRFKAKFFFYFLLLFLKFFYYKVNI